MIYGRIEDLLQYGSGIHRAEEISRFLQEHPPETLTPGRYEICGGELFLTVSQITTEPEAARRWEGHKRCADLQLVLEGEERYGVACPGALGEPTEAHEEQDLFFYRDASGAGGSITLQRGQFLYFAPEELHRPCCAAGPDTAVKKAVFKILCP